MNVKKWFCELKEHDSHRLLVSTLLVFAVSREREQRIEGVCVSSCVCVNGVCVWVHVCVPVCVYVCVCVWVHVCVWMVWPRDYRCSLCEMFTHYQEKGGTQQNIPDKCLQCLFTMYGKQGKITKEWEKHRASGHCRHRLSVISEDNEEDFAL